MMPEKVSDELNTRFHELLKGLRFSNHLLQAHTFSFEELFKEAITTEDLRVPNLSSPKLELSKELSQLRNASIQLKGELRELQPRREYSLGTAELFTKLNFKSLQLIIKLAELKPSETITLSDPELKSLRNFILSDLYSSPFTAPPSRIPKGGWFKAYPVKAYVFWESGEPQLKLKKLFKLGYERAFLKIYTYLKLNRGGEARFSYSIKYYVVLYPGKLGIEGNPRTNDVAMVVKAGDIALKASGDKIVIHLKSSDNVITTLKADLSDLAENSLKLTGGLIIRF